MKDKTILITGGTVSFGNRVANYLEQNLKKLLFTTAMKDSQNIGR